jgi:hypothetical protein
MSPIARSEHERGPEQHHLAVVAIRERDEALLRAGEALLRAGKAEGEAESLRQQLAEAAAALAVIRGALDDLEHAPFRAQALADLPDIIRAAVEGQ